MKNSFLFAFAMMVLCSCQKSVEQQEPPLQVPTQPAPAPSSGITEYLIKKGEQYSTNNPFTPVNISELKFTFKFDSSAIYQTIDPLNQVDINKLYGFADNNAAHHQFSARFGWRWKNSQLQIFAYNYNNGTMGFQQLGVAEIGTENNCSIKVQGNQYIFTFNQTVVTMPRSSTTATAVGYKLYPFFGGTETAPHDVHVWIKDL